MEKQRLLSRSKTLFLYQNLTEEISQAQKATSHAIPFTQNVQNRQIHRDRKQKSGYGGHGSGEWGVTASGVQLFSGWLELDGDGGGCTTL